MSSNSACPTDVKDFATFLKTFLPISMLEMSINNPQKNILSKRERDLTARVLS
jgi:hypothetical protein